MELKDIVLKKGDVVYFEDDTAILQFDWENNLTIEEWNKARHSNKQIIKIERPRLETIYEAPKEILDKEEKKYLEAMVRPYPRDVIIKKMCGYFNHYIVIEFKDSNNIRFPITLNSFQFQYEGMELNKEYTLDELGLFKGE